MAKFKIRPSEIGTLKYWVHVIVIAVILLTFLKYIAGHDMLNLIMILWVSAGLAVGDIFAHTVLGFD